jgi:hypothetical protein
MALDFLLLALLLATLIATAIYYGYTVLVWFTLRGLLLPQLYKWFKQDGIPNLTGLLPRHNPASPKALVPLLFSSVQIF